MYVIPVSNSPRQKFKVNIPIDGNNMFFEFEIVYNKKASYWMLTIRDGYTLKDIIANLNLTCTLGAENSNILNVYKYLRIGSAYVVPADDSVKNAPNDSQLGNKFYLVWGDTPL